jgi:hypothetical protein
MIPVGILTAAGTSSFSFLLDQFPGAAVGYSLRKLRAGYTGFCIQVRRSSDNTLQNIGFNAANKLDTVALLSFVGSGSGFIAKWYDQTTNLKDLVQATNSVQPRIVLNGILETQNSLPKIVFETMFMPIPQNVLSNSFIAFVGNSNLPLVSGVAFITYNSSPNDNPEIFIAQNDFVGIYFGGGLNMNAVCAANVYGVINLISVNNITSVTNIVYKNNIFIRSATRNGVWSTTVNEFAIGRYIRGGGYKNGQIQELIIYNNDQVANTTGINTNINTFYTIY